MPLVAKDKAINYIGVDTLQEQIRHKALREGFHFNLLVAGRGGLGKSTLVKTLFKSQINPPSDAQEEEEIIPSTTNIRTTSALIEEGGVSLKLSITDTPGFGDHVNNEHCWDPVITHIEEQYRKYLMVEQQICRPVQIEDTRIHCCLYFISPGGHELTSLDVEVLKKLQGIVNLIPVIAKADSLTPDELAQFKERIRGTLQDHNINIFPHQISEHETLGQKNELIKKSMPLGVVGSTTWHDKSGRKILGRKTKWGLIEVENKAHCDFHILRDLVIRTDMQNLIDLTGRYHYERFRKNYLEKQSKKPDDNQ